MREMKPVALRDKVVRKTLEELIRKDSELRKKIPGQPDFDDPEVWRTCLYGDKNKSENYKSAQKTARELFNQVPRAKKADLPEKFEGILDACNPIGGIAYLTITGKQNRSLIFQNHQNSISLGSLSNKYKLEMAYAFQYYVKKANPRARNEVHLSKKESTKHHVGGYLDNMHQKVPAYAIDVCKKRIIDDPLRSPAKEAVRRDYNTPRGRRRRK